MKKFRLALTECFNLVSAHGITAYLMWDKNKHQWFVGTIIVPIVYKRFEVVKTFKA